MAAAATGPRLLVAGGVFAAFVLFLYGPMLAIFVLSFQGPEGGLTFPLRGVSLHWFAKLWQGVGTVDIGSRVPPLAGARRGGDGADGAVVAAGRPGLSQEAAGRHVVVLHRGGQPDHAVDHRVAGHRLAVPTARHRHQGMARSAFGPAALDGYGTALGMFTSGARRPADMDAAVRPADHVRRVQPLQSGVRRGRARPRRHAVAEPCATWCCR